MTAVMFDDAPTQALTSLFVCMERACDELADSDATIDHSEFTVCGGKRKRDDGKDVKLIDMMRLTKKRLRGLINGSIPWIDHSVKTPAKKQMEHTLKNATAYIGDLHYGEKSDHHDLPFKVADSDDDSDEKEEEEEEEQEEEDDDAKEEANDDGDGDASDKDDAEYEEKEKGEEEEEEEEDDKDSSEEEDEEEDAD